MTVDIICAVYNGARYLPAFLDSVRAQTHREWRLWIRDDGSSDGTVAIVESLCAAEPRFHLLDSADGHVGVARAFNSLLERLPSDARYIMCADQDDVWFPDKIARTLAAMTAAEQSGTIPVLVHTDLAVVDAQLAPINPSFWAYAGVDPEPSTLRRIAVENVATGATVMINGALRAVIGAAPADAFFHDWWYACVAAAFGRVVAVRESTMLYRQHAHNAVGARARLTFRTASRAAVSSVHGSVKFRRDLERTARQARAFLDRYGDDLNATDREFLDALSRIPSQPFLARKVALLRWRALPDHGFLRTLGVVLRG